MTFLGLAVLFFLLGQLGRLSLNQQEINLYIYEIPYFAWLGYQLIKRRGSYRPKKAVVIFLGVLLITFLLGILRVSVYANVVSSLYLLRLSGYIIGFDILIESLKKKKISSKLLHLFLIVIGAVGVCQYFLYSNLRNLKYLGWDPHQSRVFGQFFDTSVAGAIYGLILIFILFDQKLFSRFVKGLYVICYTLLGLFTYSRGYLASLLASAIGYSLVVKKNLLLLILVAEIIVLFFAVAPTPFGEGVRLMRTSTIESRIIDYQKGLDLFQKNSALGIGYNRIRYFKPVDADRLSGLSHAGSSFHSSFLIILVTTGVVGLIAFLMWLGSMREYGQFAMISGMFLGVYSLFDNILLHPFILFLWPFLIGLTTSRKKQ